MRPYLVSIAVLALLLPAGPASAAAIVVHAEKDTIQLIAEGPTRTSSFALIFDREKAGISGWYDLDQDPKMERNFAPAGQGHSNTLFNLSTEVVLSGKIIGLTPGPAKSMSLVESNPERVVISFTGALHKLDGLRASDEAPRMIEMTTGRVVVGDILPFYEIRYTVYPTGQVYIHLSWDYQGTGLVIADHHAVLANAPSDDFTAINDCDDAKRALSWPATFVLHSAAGPAYKAEALLAVHSGQYNSDWLGQRSSSTTKKTGWFRSGFALLAATQELSRGAYTWDFLLNVEPATAGKRLLAFDVSEPYRHPDTLKLINVPGMVDGTTGRLELHEPGDTNADGFSERDGAYNLVSGPKGIAFSISAEKYPRVNPVFHVSAWRSAVPEEISFNGKVIHRNAEYNAFVAEDALVLQYLGSVGARAGEFVIPQGARP